MHIFNTNFINLNKKKSPKPIETPIRVLHVKATLNKIYSYIYFHVTEGKMKDL